MKKAGVSLSRTAGTQSREGRVVFRSDLQPGDLVYFHSSTRSSHIGLYARQRHLALPPRPGKSVEYIKVSYMPFAGARRPG